MIPRKNHLCLIVLLLITISSFLIVNHYLQYSNPKPTGSGNELPKTLTNSIGRNQAESLGVKGYDALEESFTERSFLPNVFKLWPNLSQWYRNTFLDRKSLEKFRNYAIKKERKVIAREIELMGNFNNQNNASWRPSFKNLLIEQGGQPIRNILMTTWRSGSTFVGEILNSHPGTFYHYEPLLHLGTVRVRSGDLRKRASEIIRNVLNCSYTSDYTKFGDTNSWFHSHNTRLAQYCQLNPEVCHDPGFLSAFCKLFPFQALKTVRMTLHFGKTLLTDSKMDVRLLYLVRDPRGTLQSRSHQKWCTGVPDCESPKILCRDLEDDFYAARSLRRRYPGRFMILRYEYFALNIFEAVPQIFNFFRLEYYPQVKAFLKSHTTNAEDEDNLYSTRKNSKMVPFHWKHDFQNNFKKVEEIQFECSMAMSLWGYNLANNVSHMLSFNPISAMRL